jgi:hypothetical protein
MPATISAEAHLFLSKGRAKISLDYLSRLIQLGADPFRDPLLEGLEGKESLIYASMTSATLVLPSRPLRLVAPGLVKGLARLLLACPKPRLRFGRMAQPHFFSSPRKVRWQIRLATRPHFVFRLGAKEFFVVTRLRFEKGKKKIWIGVLGRKKKRISRSRQDARPLVATSTVDRDL